MAHEHYLKHNLFCLNSVWDSKVVNYTTAQKQFLIDWEIEKFTAQAEAARIALKEARKMQKNLEKEAKAKA